MICSFPHNGTLAAFWYGGKLSARSLPWDVVKRRELMPGVLYTPRLELAVTVNAVVRVTRHCGCSHPIPGPLYS